MNQLRKKFYTRFIFEGIICLFALIFLIVMACLQWINYIQNNQSIIYAIIFTGLFIIIFFITIIILKPYYKDLKVLKRNGFQIIIGTVEGYKKEVANSDPPTTDYYPIIKDIINNDIKILKVEKTEIGKTYKFIYLPFTKLAEIVSEE